MTPDIPKLPLPSPLLGSEVGTFTEYTVTQRMPAIARRVITENNYPENINDCLKQLASELPSESLSPLLHDTGVDFSDWMKYLQPFKGQRWIDVPWFLAETYFYRLILEITNYFRKSQFQGVDPFQLEKNKDLETSLDSTRALCIQLNQWLADAQKEELNQTALIALLYFALWGNRVDLSLWSALESERSHFDIQSQQSHILVDDAAKVTELLASKGKRIDFVIDNAGFELVCDLCLLDFLLGSGVASQVKLHLKPHPTFVSDAMIKDVLHTIEFLAADNHEDVTSFAKRLQENIASNRLVLSEDYFWTSPLAFWEIPDTLKSDLSAANLIVIKGDANYRRLLGDRHWDFTTNFADIVSYFSVPIVALRTLKSEVVAGLKPEVIQQVAKSDSDWLTNGQWGVIQLVD
ncbi:damage-control phosphatase ARMT1 family protein [Tolypothrix sp. VBCCA 56010]|uniref:damage-control phosphatase ARMT1 family protein n=1 Tax=Tolypothrix sp. VBCCA 56010 TaxID=3137731 RepID=UPI003D7E8B23